MRNPFAARRFAGAPSPRRVPPPEVMAGVEFLDTPRADHREGPPDVALCGLDPRVPGEPATPKIGLVVREGARPDSVAQMLDVCGDRVAIRRVTVDVRPFRDVLEARGGWNVLAQLVRDPADDVTNAVFRASVADLPVGGPLEPGDVDCDVAVVGEGDTVAGRCRHELGRARLALTPFLAASERLTRRLAEAIGRPRDRAVRRCLEHALADAIADRTAEPGGLATLLAAPVEAPWCAVPGRWSAAPAPFAPAVPRRVPSPA